MSVSHVIGDCRDVLPTMFAESVHCVVTSPPYFGLRDYGVDGQIGLETSLAEYVETLVAVFREVRRVLRRDGTCWLNLGDSYAGGGNGVNWDRKRDIRRNAVAGREGRRSRGDGLKPKDLMMVPARVALALQADGWWIRSEIVWAKPNPMPESVTDRPTCAHEKVFLLTRSARYWYDAEAVRRPRTSDEDRPTFRGGCYVGGQPGRSTDTGNVRSDKQRGHSRRHAGFNERWDSKPRDEQVAGANLRNVWTIATRPFAEAHYATFPPDLVEICIRAGCPPGGTVLDPFGGAGTVGLVADRLQRDAVLIELNPDYGAMADRRIAADRGPLFVEAS